MSQAKVLPIFLPNRGPKLDAPSQLLNEHWSSYSRNMEFRDEAIRGRSGLTEFFPDYPLDNPVLRIDQFWQADETYDLLFFTTRDVARADFDNDRYDYLTPLYTTGTIEVQAGTPTILRGTGTLWLTNAKVGDYIKIGSGSVHTGSTWYRVTVVTSDVLLTVHAAMPTTGAGANYVLRKTFTGDTNDMWDGINFLDTNQGHMYIAVNGVDTPIYLTSAATAVVKFATLPTGFTTAKYVWTLNQRLVFLRTVEGGSNQNNRVRWSGVADFTSYNDLHFRDLVQPDASSFIVGAHIAGESLFIAKDFGGNYRMRFIDTDDIFEFSFDEHLEGNHAPFSIVPHANGFFYFAFDSGFHYWTAIKDDVAFEEISPEFRDQDPDDSVLIQGVRLSYKKQIRWVMPYNDTDLVSPVFVYDYEKDHAEYWEYKLGASTKKIRCIGEFLNLEDLYVDDSDWAELYVDENDGYWDARNFLANAPIILYGCEDGRVFKADVGSDDDSVAYTRAFRLKRDDHGSPQQNKRLSRQQWWFESQASGSATLKMRKNDAAAWDGDTKSISMAESGVDITKPFVTWNKYYECAEIQVEATGPIGIIGLLNYVHGKRSTRA